MRIAQVQSGVLLVKQEEEHWITLAGGKKVLINPRQPGERGKRTTLETRGTYPTTDERAALAEWIIGDYDALQEASQTGEGGKEMVEHLRALDGFLDRSTPYRGRVWRGLSDLSREQYDEFASIDTGTITFDCLQSGTNDEGEARNFANGAYSEGNYGAVLYIKQNKSGVKVTDIAREVGGEAAADYAAEDEIVLRKGAKYQIDRREEEEVTGEYGQDMKIVTLYLSEVT